MENKKVYKVFFWIGFGVLLAAVLILQISRNSGRHYVRVDIDRHDSAEKYEFFLKKNRIDYEVYSYGHFKVYADSLEDEAEKMKNYYQWDASQSRSEGVLVDSGLHK